MFKRAAFSLASSSVAQHGPPDCRLDQRLQICQAQGGCNRIVWALSGASNLYNKSNNCRPRRCRIEAARPPSRCRGGTCTSALSLPRHEPGLSFRCCRNSTYAHPAAWPPGRSISVPCGTWIPQQLVPHKHDGNASRAAEATCRNAGMLLLRNGGTQRSQWLETATRPNCPPSGVPGPSGIP